MLWCVINLTKFWFRRLVSVAVTCKNFGRHQTQGGTSIWKKYAVSFFFNASLTELTDYIIRHISKYSNIMSSLSSYSAAISAGFCPNSASFHRQKSQGSCAVGFLHQSCFGPIEKGKQGSIFLHFQVLVLFSLCFQADLHSMVLLFKVGKPTGNGATMYACPK